MPRQEKVDSSCDCCGKRAWKYLFEQNGFHLGRCVACGLHYVAEMPSQDQRQSEMGIGRYGIAGEANLAECHDAAEVARYEEFTQYVTHVKEMAPLGRWLDVGCGTGVLLSIVESRGIVADGIELTPTRRAIAASRVRGTIYDRPLEDLHLPDGGYAAVFMINVFSHLTQPIETLREVSRILRPQGVLLLYTSEIGVGVKRYHKRGWNLGDHLYFLGEDSISTYARRINLQVIKRHKQWEPERILSRERLQVPGPSKGRNIVKQIARLPGVHGLLRLLIMTWQRTNPIYASIIILRRS